MEWTRNHPSWIEGVIKVNLVYSFILGLYTMILAGEAQQENKTINMNTMMLEECKELLGLLIVILWLSLLIHDNFLRIKSPWLSILVGVILAILPLISWALVETYHHC